MMKNKEIDLNKIIINGRKFFYFYYHFDFPYLIKILNTKKLIKLLFRNKL